MTVSSATVDQAIANPNVPNAMATLGSLVQTANGINAYQSGAIDLQQKQIANAEMQQVTAAVRNKDPDLLPGPDGIIDQAKSLSKLQQLAPRTWNVYAGNINQNNSQQTTVNRQLTALGQDKLNALADVAGSLAAAKAPESDIADRFGDFKAANPTVAPLVDRALDAIKAANGDKEKISSIVQHIATRTSTLANNFNAYQGEPQLVNQGPQAQPTIMQERFSGKAPGTAVGNPVEMGTAPSYQLNNLNVPKFLPGRMQNWTEQSPAGGPQPPAPSKAAAKPAANVVVPPPLPQFPDKPTADRVSQYQTKWQTASAANADPITGYQNTMQIYKNLNQELKKNPKLGPGAPEWNRITGILSPFGANSNSDYQQVSAYLESLGQARSNTAGATTNMGREQSQAAVGSPTYVHDALQEKLRFGAATSEGANIYAQGSAAYARKYGNSGLASGQSFDSAYSRNADPIALRLMAAKTVGDDEDYKATMKKATPLVLYHYQNLLTLRGGDIPKDLDAR